MKFNCKNHFTKTRYCKKKFIKTPKKHLDLQELIYDIGKLL